MKEVPRLFLKQSKAKQSLYTPGQTLKVPQDWGSQISRESAYEGGKFVSLKQRPTLPTGKIPGTHFSYRVSKPQGHSATGRILSMKISNDTIGNWTRDLPSYSAVPQTTACPRLFLTKYCFVNLKVKLNAAIKKITRNPRITQWETLL